MEDPASLCLMFNRFYLLYKFEIDNSPNFTLEYCLYETLENTENVIIYKDLYQKRDSMFGLPLSVTSGQLDKLEEIFRALAGHEISCYFGMVDGQFFIKVFNNEHATAMRMMV